MCKRVERICQVDPEGWYAPVIGEELVRCKDCKYKNKYSYCTFYLNFHHLTADMDYCSDAERKEEWHRQNG